MALSDFPKLASGFFQFIKGKMDWHEPLNKNFEEQASRNEDVSKKLTDITSGMGAYANKTDLASTAVGKGASLIGVADTANYFASNVLENILNEIASYNLRTYRFSLLADAWYRLPHNMYGDPGRGAALLLLSGGMSGNGNAMAIFALVKGSWTSHSAVNKLVFVPKFNTTDEFSVQWTSTGIDVKFPTDLPYVSATLLYCYY